MKKLIMICLITALGTGVSIAQKQQKPKMDPVERATKRTDRMKEELNLSQAQYDQLLEIHTAHAKEMAAERENEQVAREERKAEMKKRKDAIDAEISAILTEDQKIKWEQIKAEKAQERKERHKNKAQQTR